MDGKFVRVVDDEDFPLMPFQGTATIGGITVREGFKSSEEVWTHEVYHVLQGMFHKKLLWATLSASGQLLIDVMSFSYNGTELEAEATFAGEYWKHPDSRNRLRREFPLAVRVYESWLNSEHVFDTDIINVRQFIAEFNMTTFEEIPFAFTNLPGWFTGEPDRIVVHRDGNANPHTALGALTWGNRERAFSIHYYLEGLKRYVCVPETWQAFHVLEARIAEQKGYRTDWPGLTKKRGDIHAIGIECVQDATGHLSQDTRRNLVDLVANIETRRQLPIFEHATFDPWTRGHDMGDALNIPDLIQDVADVRTGLTAWRTVGETANGQPVAIRPETPTEPEPTEPEPAPEPTPTNPLGLPDGHADDHQRLSAQLRAVESSGAEIREKHQTHIDVHRTNANRF